MRLSCIVVSVLAVASSADVKSAEAGGCGIGSDMQVCELIERARRHPFVLFTDGQIPSIKRMIESDVRVRNVWESVRKRADAAICRPVEIPDRGGEWSHYFNCRKCAMPLKSESPTRHVCSSCGEVHSGWPYDDVYLMDVHFGILGKAVACGVSYRLTGDRRYAAFVRDVLLAYSAKYETYPLHSVKGQSAASAGRLGPQTLEESACLYSIVCAYDLAADTMTDEERMRVESGLIRPCAQVVHKLCRGINNWECNHLSAYGIAGLVLGDRQLVADAFCGKCGYLRQIEEGFSGDGVWNEGSWGYHFYTMRAINRFVRALQNIGVPPPERYRRAFEVAFGQVMPDFTLPASNDSGCIRLREEDVHFEYALAFWNDPLYAWWLSEVKTRANECLYFGTATAVERDAPRFASGLFPGSGVAVMRSRSLICRSAMPDNYVSLDFGSHGGWHGHPDKLSMTLFARGELLAEDPGKVAYSNPRQWGWYRSTLAHNTLVMDGINQRPACGCCDAFATDDFATIASVMAGEAFGAATAGRLTALLDDIVLDCLWVHDEREHEYSWAFHGRGEFSSSVPMEALSLPPPTKSEAAEANAGMDVKNDGREAWSWVENVAEGPHDGTWRARWKKGSVELNLLQCSPAGTLRTGVGSGQPVSVRMKMAVNRLPRMNEALFATVMTMDGVSDMEVLRTIGRPEGAEGFVARVGNRRFEVVRSLSGNWRDHAARVAIVELDDGGRVIRALYASDSGQNGSGEHNSQDKGN